MDNPAGAAAAYREALKLDPDNAALHYNLSLALKRLGEHEAQQRELEKAIELAPNLSQAYCELGLLYLSKGRREDAARALKNALAVDPGYVPAKEALASLSQAPTR